MAQLTIYLDERVRKRIETAARKAKSSVSQWVKERLEDALDKDWPKDYFELFGSLANDNLERPSQLDLADDVRREKL